MRSQRHKYVRHCSTDCLIAHKAGWKVFPYYPMQSGRDYGYKFYKLKHYIWWTTVHRWDWRFTNDYDRENFTISNMEYVKWRKCRPYEMFK